MNAQLTITHLTKKFEAGTPNEKHALHDFSLEVAKGDFITILGSNGAGKSTFLKILSGEIDPTSGSVSLARLISAVCIRTRCAERHRT